MSGRVIRVRGNAMKLLLADRHRLVLEGLRAVLETARDVEVVGETHHGSQVLPLVKRLQPELVALDLGMTEADGASCLELLKAHYPSVKVIVLGTSDPDSEEAALKSGAHGYFAKTLCLDDLPAAIRQVAEGAEYRAFGVQTGESTSPALDAKGLTSRELAILRAAARGLSNRAIGAELWVTEQTVKFHLTNIYRKLNVGNRTEATRAALRWGVVDSSENQR
jgi:DNA-binding NarL/FixJ family response regulator